MRFNLSTSVFHLKKIGLNSESMVENIRLFDNLFQFN